MDFNERLRVIIKFKGLQQKELAQGIKVSESMVSRWLKGLAMPRAKQLIKLSKFLEISLPALVGQEELLDRLLESYDKGLFIA